MESLLNLNPGLIIWTFVTFFIVLFVLKKFAWKPLLTMLEKREEGIKSDLTRAEHAREESERLLNEHKKNLQNTEAEARRIIDEARITAKQLGDEIVEKANTSARNLAAQAKAEIQREKETALSQLREEVANLAIQAASKILDEDMNDERHRKMVDSYINLLPKN